MIITLSLLLLLQIQYILIITIKTIYIFKSNYRKNKINTVLLPNYIKIQTLFFSLSNYIKIKRRHKF